MENRIVTIAGCRALWLHSDRRMLLGLCPDGSVRERRNGRWNVTGTVVTQSVERYVALVLSTQGPVNRYGAM